MGLSLFLLLLASWASVVNTNFSKCQGLPKGSKTSVDEITVTLSRQIGSSVDGDRPFPFCV